MHDMPQNPHPTRGGGPGGPTRLERRMAWTRQEPDSWAAARYLAEAYLADASTLELAEKMAQKALEAVAGQNRQVTATAQVLDLLARARLRLGRQSELLETARQWTGLEPKNPDPHYYAAFALCRQGKWSLCARAAQSHMELSAKERADAGPVRRHICRTHDRQGHILALFAFAAHEMGQPEPAQKALHELGSLPDAGAQCAGFMDLARGYGLERCAGYLAEKLGGPAPPQAEAGAGIPRNDGAATPADLLRQGSRMIEQGELEKAAPLLSRGLALHPDHPQLLGEMGYLQNALGNYVEAVSYYERLVEVLPDQPAPLYNLAVARVRLGQEKAARQLLWRCLDVSPDFSAASQLLNRLDQDW